MVAGDRVDLLAPMRAQSAVMAHDFRALHVVGEAPQASVVAEIEGDVPVKGRTAKFAAFLGLP